MPVVLLSIQPIYMGGAIKAANDMAAIGEQVAQNNISLKRQLVLYGVDNAYWLAISLKKKEALATRYRDLAQKLNEDVKKMIREGVATRADGLKVEVAVNTADMQIARIQSGVSLAKMALCELCGLDLMVIYLCLMKVMPTSLLLHQRSLTTIQSLLQIQQGLTKLVQSYVSYRIAVDLSIQEYQTYSFTLYASCTSYCWLFRIKSESL